MKKINKSGSINSNNLKWVLGKKNINDKFKLGDIIFVKNKKTLGF